MSIRGFGFYALLIALLSLGLPIGTAVADADVDPLAGTTMDIGTTGFVVKRPVLAAACIQGCPWGELGEFVRDALQPSGYEVVLCNNCNRTEGPRIVSRASRPPPLVPSDLEHGTNIRVNAPIDFGITESGFLAAAYNGRGPYAHDGPFRNLRLIAKIEDPTYLLVAVKAASNINDLGDIKTKRLPVRIWAAGPASMEVLADYGLTRNEVGSWGGSFVEDGHAAEQDVDVLVSDLASPANNPESALWSAVSQRVSLRFLDLPERLLARLSQLPGEQRVTAQWGLLRGVDRPIKTVGRSGEAVFCRTDIPENTAYEIAKAIDLHRGELKWYIRPYSYDTRTVFQNLDVPLSPGAERYYREEGYMR